MRTLWLVALILLVPTALGANGELVATSHLPISIAGQHDQNAEGSFMLQGNDGTADVQLQATDGTLTRVIHRAFGYARQDDPQAGVLWHQQVRRIPISLDDATVTVTERFDDFTFLSHGQLTGSGATSTTGILQEPLYVSMASSAEWSVAVNIGDVADEAIHEFPAGDYQVYSDAGSVLGTDVVGSIAGATVRIAQPDEIQTLQANFRVERQPGSVYNPLDDTWVGQGSHEEYVLEYHLIEALGNLHVQYDATPTFLMAPQLQFAVLGEATLPSASGTVTIVETGETHQFSQEDLVLGGMYTMDVKDGNPATVQGEGDFTKVSYGSTQATYDWANVAAAVGIGTLVLAGAAWLLGQAKGVAFLGGYARVQGEEILQHPGRQTVYDLVKANPGNNFQELQDQVSFGSSTLNYHLRVLEKNEYVTRVKDGRYVRFFDRHNGEYSAGRKTAISTLQNRTTAAIAQHIIQFPGTPQCDLAARFGIAPSTVSWHIRRLSEAGLVDRARDQHYTRYYMGDAWSTLPSQELQRFGVA